MKKIASFSIICLLIIPVWAFAETHGGEHAGLPWMLLLKQLLHFAILVGLLIYFLKKPISNFLKDRRELLIKSMDEAKKANEEARETLSRMENKLSAIGDQVENLEKQMDGEAAAEIERIQSLTQSEINRIKDQASFTADQEVKKAKQELRKEVAELSLASAEKIIEASVTDEDQKKFIADSVDKIGGGKS